jgi:hypothetical protein
MKQLVARVHPFPADVETMEDFLKLYAWLPPLALPGIC